MGNKFGNHTTFGFSHDSLNSLNSVKTFRKNSVVIYSHVFMTELAEQEFTDRYLTFVCAQLTFDLAEINST